MSDITSRPRLPFARPSLDAQTIREVCDVLASGFLSTGPKSAAFEARLSELLGGRTVRAFANGTASLEIALRLAGVGPGDEVITTPITWAATANVIVGVQAKPVFVDIDPSTRNLDLAAVEAAVTSRTRALMPVFLAGLPVDMDRLYAIAARHRLRVIEDAAQAFGSRWKGRAIGSFGDLVSFSFQATKNITCAEGGCLVVQTPEEAGRAELLRLQGVVRSGLDGMDIATPGGKSNLSDVHAAIGLGQLRQLESITSRRRSLADAYFEAASRYRLEEFGITLPLPTNEEGATTNWHLFQVMLPASSRPDYRSAIMAGLLAHGIGTGVHYPAIHLFSYYRALGWRSGLLPHAEEAGRRLLTLPLFTAMSEDDVDRASAALADVCRQTTP